MSTESKTGSDELSFSEINLRLKQVFKYLLSKWLIIMLLAIIGGGIGIAYAWSQVKKYEAVVTFSTEDGKSSGGGLASLAAQFGVDISGATGAFSGENILVLLNSNKITLSTLSSKVTVNGRPQSLLRLFCDVYETNKFFKHAPEKDVRELCFPDNQLPENYSRLQDSVLQMIVATIKKSIVKVERPDAKVNLYKITCRSKDELFSAEYAKALIKQASVFYVNTKTQRSSQIVSILQSRTDSVRRAFNAALYGRASISDENLNTAFQSATVGIQSKQADITVLSTAYGELLKNLELAKFNLLKDTPVIQVLDEPMLPLKIVKLGRLLAGIVGAFILGFLCTLYFFFKKLANPSAK